MIYRIRHLTSYAYEEPVIVSHHAIHLTPKDTPRQICNRVRIETSPAAEVMTERFDYFRNRVVFFALQEPHRELQVTAVSEVSVFEPAAPQETCSWNEAARLMENPASEALLAAYEFTLDSLLVPGQPAIRAYASSSFSNGRPLLEAAMELTSRIHQDFAYDPDATEVTTPLAQFFEMRRGVCQDFAHLQIACLRAMGLPARYVSGYLQTISPPGKLRLTGADASHAWVSVYEPNYGWIDLDPTNCMIPSSTHITLAWGRDYSDVSPMRGVILGGGPHFLNVSVDVAPFSPE